MIKVKNQAGIHLAKVEDDSHHFLYSYQGGVGGVPFYALEYKRNKTLKVWLYNDFEAL